jgi:hypothetical protein
VNIKKFSLALICAGITAATESPVRADTREDVLSGIQRCGAIRDDRTWLECLYGAHQPMRAQLRLPPAPESQQRLVPLSQPGIAAPKLRSSAQQVPRKKAGFFQTLIGNVPPVATSRMASYHYETSGAFVVSLVNGQEWRQANLEGEPASWVKPPSRYLVTITPGVFGNFLMRTDDNPRTYKVQRVR